MLDSGLLGAIITKRDVSSVSTFAVTVLLHPLLAVCNRRTQSAVIPQRVRILTSPHACQPLSVLLIVVISVGVKWYHSVGLICVSLMANEHLFLLLIGHLYVFGETSISIFAHFKIGFSLLLNCKSPLCFLDTNS